MEAPALGRVYAELRDRSVEVVAINISPQYSLQEWQTFWRNIGADDVLWAQDTDGSATRAYQIRALGTTVVIDRQGRVVYRDEGATSYDTLRQAVQEAL
ncbi:MAG: TlpA family protein disulfide reductase [Dehalococcoidia bacterium]